MIYWSSENGYNVKKVLDNPLYYHFNILFKPVYHYYQNKYNSTEEMFLCKLSFNSLINILYWIPILKLHVLLARMEGFSGQSTVLPKSTWSHTAELWDLFLANFSVSGETLMCLHSIILVGFTNVFSTAAVTLKLIH